MTPLPDTGRFALGSLRTRRAPALLPALLLAAVLPLAAGLASCTTATMSVPRSLAGVSPMPVSGANPRAWNRPIEFGPWRSTEVREGLQWSIAPRIFGIEVELKRQPYRMMLEGPEGGELQVECVTRRLAISRDRWSVDPTLGRLPALACGFRDVATGEEWSMKLSQGVDRLAGEIRANGERWPLGSIHRPEGSRIEGPEPLGYEVLEDGRALAAVQVVNRGRIWIQPDLPLQTRDRLAAVAAALLLFDEESIE